MFLNQITYLINKFEIILRNKTIAELKKKKTDLLKRIQ